MQFDLNKMRDKLLKEKKPLEESEKSKDEVITRLKHLNNISRTTYNRN